MSNVLDKKDPTFKERIEWLEKALGFRVEPSSPSSESNEVTSTTTQTEKEPPLTEKQPEESPSTKSESSPKQPEENRENENQAYRARIYRETEDRVALDLPGLKILETQAIGCLPAGDKSLESLQSALDSLETARKNSIYSIKELDLTKFNFAVERVEKLRREANAAGELVLAAVETEANRRAELRKGIDEHPAQTLIREYPIKTSPLLPRLEKEGEWRSKLESLVMKVNTDSQSEMYKQDDSNYSAFEDVASGLKKQLDQWSTSFTELDNALKEESSRRTEETKKLKQSASKRQENAKTFTTEILKKKNKNEKLNNAIDVLAKETEVGSNDLQPVVDFSGDELSYAEYQLAVERLTGLIESFDNKVDKNMRLFQQMESIGKNANEKLKKNEETIYEFSTTAKEQIEKARLKIYSDFYSGKYSESVEKANAFLSLVESLPKAITEYNLAIKKCELTLSSTHKDLSKPRDSLMSSMKGLKEKINGNIDKASDTIETFNEDISNIEQLSNDYSNAIKEYESTINSLHTDLQVTLTKKKGDLSTAINSDLPNPSAIKTFNSDLSALTSLSAEYTMAIEKYESTAKSLHEDLSPLGVKLVNLKEILKASIEKNLINTLKSFQEKLSTVEKISTEYDNAINNYNSTIKDIHKSVKGPLIPLENLKKELKELINNGKSSSLSKIGEFKKKLLDIKLFSNKYSEYLNNEDTYAIRVHGTEKEKKSLNDRVSTALNSPSLDFEKLISDIEGAKTEAIEANRRRLEFSQLKDKLDEKIALLKDEHEAVFKSLNKAKSSIRVNDLGYEVATRQINELSNVSDAIIIELNELTEVDSKGRETIKEVHKEFDSILRSKAGEVRKAIVDRCVSPTSTKGVEALEELKKIYSDITVFTNNRSELEKVHNYARTVKNAFPSGGVLGQIRKNFEEAGKKLNFEEAKRNFNELVIRLEVSRKSSETLRRVNVVCKYSPKDLTVELSKLYEQCVSLVDSGKTWSETGLEELLKTCSDMLPKLFEAAAKKIRTDKEESYIEGTKKASELALVQPQHQSNLAETWNEAESLAKEGKYEDAIKTYEKVPGQLTIITNLHVKLPFLKAWEEYKEEWKRVAIPEGTIRNQVTSKANDIRINTTDEVVGEEVINSAKSEIEKLKKLLEYYAKFEKQYPNVKKDFEELRGRKEKKLHSKQLNSIEDLHKAALSKRFDDPINSLANLKKLADRIVDIKAKLVNFHGDPVPKPKPKGGSGFEKATTEEDAKDIAVKYITDGGITLRKVAKMIPGTETNSFLRSDKYQTGFKYTWTTTSGVTLEIYGHGPTVNPKVSEDSDNKRGNVLRIKINGKYLRPDGSLTAKATDATSHMSLY